MATALGAALHGRPVTVFEAGDQIGGAAAYSGGQVWVGGNHVAARQGIDDDLERTEKYVRGIALPDPELLDEQAMQRWIRLAPEAMRYWEEVGAVEWTIIDGLSDYHTYVEGALPNGRYLTGAPVDGSRLGEWRHRLLVSPYFRPGTTYEVMFEEGRRSAAREREQAGDPLALGTGLVAGFLARALAEPNIEILVGTRATDLLQDASGAVVGARAEGPDGRVERRGTVVLATSSFDWNPQLVEELLGLDAENFGSMAPPTVRGDGITLARSVGGNVLRMPAPRVPLVPGWASATGLPYRNGPEYAMPHAMIVDRSARRFSNDSYWVDMTKRALDPADPHVPMFLIWDEQHHRKYGLGDTPAGGAYPEGLVTSAGSLRELGEALGIDGDELEATAATFSKHAEEGRDPQFGRGSVDFIDKFSGDPEHRPSPVLGPITEPPFHGMRLLLLGVGIGCSGVGADAYGRVLDQSGAVVTGLYAVGSCAATTTFGGGYNSGMALSRGLTIAYSIATESRPAPGTSTD